MPLLESFKEHIFNPVVYLLFIVAMLVFFFGIVQYMLSGDKGGREGVNNIIYGIVGMAIMFSVFGIMAVITATISSFVS